MMQFPETLKTRYRFADFLFYTCLLAVPLLTAILAILKHSVLGAVVFGALAVVVTALLLKFYCTRCPHYTREGKRLKCLFFWGL
ncbi:MAG: hypothetical protein MUP74_01885, partial [Desulfobacterales bacterium]|nr:hypothetical protein [Desulfobacterales bacterium]